MWALASKEHLLRNREMSRKLQSETTLAPRVEQRNLRCGIVHGAFFHMGTAFADPYAVVPLFLAGFTESRALIGLIVSLIEALSIVPQLGVARLIRRKPDFARPIMLAGIWTRCGVWGIIALTIVLMPNRMIWILAVFMCLVALYSLDAGFAVLPLRRIISETISARRRSTFFGGRLLAGGLLAVAPGHCVNPGEAIPRVAPAFRFTNDNPMERKTERHIKGGL